MTKILILGGGPTGLGAAHRLEELSTANWELCEKNSYVGGLSASFADPAGFTWDVGGHVLFSHYPYFDRVVEQALEGSYYEHMRESWVRMLGTWVPYPFQNNIRYLPRAAREECVEGLRDLPGSPGGSRNFKEWMDSVFGRGIVKYFMEPYNRKVWAVPPELMSKDWIAERVSVVDLERIEKNIAEQKDDVSWGPNNTFKFPRKGGTGAIYNGIARGIKGRVHLDHDLAAVDLERKILTFTNGRTVSYEKLISTLPVDQFVAKCSGLPAEVRQAARELVHNGVFVVGIGVHGRRRDDRCWMYFPEADCPFYRVTNFHNYSPYNVPGGDVENFFSLMCETSYSPFKPVSRAGIVEETIRGLVNTGMLGAGEVENIVSRYLIDVPYAYPVPTTGRDAALATLQSFLEAREVFSRGRFGAWKYEVGNMDHSFMQGVEVVDRLLGDGDEPTFRG